MNFDDKIRIKDSLNIDFTDIMIYQNSLQKYNNSYFFIGKENNNKYLYILFDKEEEVEQLTFEGEITEISGMRLLKKCSLSTVNRKALQNIFEFTRPVCFGLDNSFGFGDRLGHANPAHLRSLGRSSFRPVLAQQSIRELTRTKRTPSEVMDAAVWAAFQEGYKEGFGADADHLKTPEDIDIMVSNGFRMFTFDPGEYVNNEADSASINELDNILKSLNWRGISSDLNSLSELYLNKEFVINDNLVIRADVEQLKRALVKYGNAVAHIKMMYDHLKNSYPDYESEVEVSVDETESVTSVFEHFFISSELKRLNVVIVSLAPRFIGSFEKGIDYKGDLNVFEREYIRHVNVSTYFGSYKISLHSGSDKFAVYKIIGSLNLGPVHIKTAGTSYLEALRTLAIKEPPLFREILNYCRGLYEKEKKTYHVSADINKVKPAEEYTDDQLESLFELDDARQVLHVTFGRVLTDKNSDNGYIFKNRFLECLIRNEEMHYKNIIKHFRRHLQPFE
jgi:tagaturonate epimerase